MEDSIEDEVGNILRESYLHPLYRNDDNIEEEINNDEEEVESEGENEEIEDLRHELSVENPL